MYIDVEEASSWAWWRLGQIHTWSLVSHYGRYLRVIFIHSLWFVVVCVWGGGRAFLGMCKAGPYPYSSIIYLLLFISHVQGVRLCRAVLELPAFFFLWYFLMLIRFGMWQVKRDRKHFFTTIGSTVCRVCGYFGFTVL